VGCTEVGDLIDNDFILLLIGAQNIFERTLTGNNENYIYVSCAVGFVCESSLIKFFLVKC
jgi:hypothetical protein